MRLAWHILRHDLQQFRLGIAAWVLLTVGTALYQGLAPRLGPTDPTLSLMWTGAMAVVVTRWLLGVSLIVLVVQAHSVVGTTAWWMTRPVHPGTLLGSRLLLLGLLFIAVPGLCDVALMSAHGVPLADSALVMVQWSLVRSLGVLVVMSAAAATATFAAFALFAGIAVAAVVLAFAGVLLLLSARSAPGPDPYIVPANAVLAITSRWPDQTAAIAAWLIGLVGLAMIVRTRYRRTPLVRAGWLAGATLTAAVAALSFWPWQLLHAAVTAPSWASPGRSLQLSGPAGQAIFFDIAGVRLNPDGRPRWRTAHARVQIDGLPEGWYAMAYPVRGALTIDGKTLTSGPAPYAVGLPRQGDDERADTRTTALEDALQVTTINGSRLRDTTSAAPILRVRSTEAPSDPVFAAYDGEFEVGLHRVEIARVLPAAVGSEFQEGAYRLTVTGVRLTEGGPRLDVRWSDASSVFHRAPDPQYQVFLRNAATGEALAGELRMLTPALPSPEAALLGREGYIGMGFGFRTESGVVSFPSTMAAGLPSERLPNGRFSYDDEPWMRGAELVIVRTVLGGIVRLPVKIDRVAVNGGPRP